MARFILFSHGRASKGLSPGLRRLTCDQETGDYAARRCSVGILDMWARAIRLRVQPPVSGTWDLQNFRADSHQAGFSPSAALECPRQRCALRIFIGERDETPGQSFATLAALLLDASAVVQCGAECFPWVDDPLAFAKLARHSRFPLVLS